MKALKKKTLIAKRQLRYAVTEANVLKTAKHPFILGLNYAFQVDYLKIEVIITLICILDILDSSTSLPCGRVLPGRGSISPLGSECDI